MTDTVPDLNVDRLNGVLDFITKNPDRLDMDSWCTADPDKDRVECGTTMCFAGWAVAMYADRGAQFVRQGNEPEGLMGHVEIGGGVHLIEDVATVLLGLTEEESAALFYSGNSEVEDVARGIIRGEWR